ncbi:MAG: CoA-binding protein [Desulfatiglandales bacterium]
MEISCEVPSTHLDDEEIARLLKETKRIAVIGISQKPDRDSYKVAKYLLEQGFDMIPVNPIRKEILGQRCYPSLLEIPFEVDMADLFLSPDKVPKVVEEAIKKGVRSIWMQIGVVHNEAAKKAMEHGIKVVMNRCVMREHERLRHLIVNPNGQRL